MYRFSFQKPVAKRSSGPKQRPKQQPRLPKYRDHEREEKDILTKISAIVSLYSSMYCNQCNRMIRQEWVQCGLCDMAQYCSLQCSKKDLIRHDKDCSKMQELKGSLQELHKAHNVFPKYKEKLALLISQHDSHFCSHCAKLAPTECPKGWKCCAKCTTARYCSQQCQVKDWGGRHRNDCREMRKLQQLLHDDVMAEEDVLTHHDVTRKLIEHQLIPARHFREMFNCMSKMDDWVFRF